MGLNGCPPRIQTVWGQDYPASLSCWWLLESMSQSVHHKSYHREMKKTLSTDENKKDSTQINPRPSIVNRSNQQKIFTEVFETKGNITGKFGDRKNEKSLDME